MVIRGKVNSRMGVQLLAVDANRDPITFSLLSPRPGLPSISSSETHSRTHAHARTHARTHARMHSRTHTHRIHKLYFKV